jgi:hypothetical protein
MNHLGLTGAIHTEKSTSHDAAIHASSVIVVE